MINSMKKNKGNILPEIVIAIFVSISFFSLTYFAFSYATNEKQKALESEITTSSENDDQENGPKEGEGQDNSIDKYYAKPWNE